MPEPEDTLAHLPVNAVKRSVQVLLEWMKADREATNRRFDAQDRILAEIHKETRLTNGRVTALEGRVDLAKALDDGREEWERRDDERAERRRARQERLRDVTIGGVLVIIGGIGHDLGHLLGFW